MSGQERGFPDPDTNPQPQFRSSAIATRIVAQLDERAEELKDVSRYVTDRVDALLYGLRAGAWRGCGDGLRGDARGCQKVVRIPALPPRTYTSDGDFFAPSKPPAHHVRKRGTT